MTPNLSVSTQRVSSKITKLVKVLVILLGIPISFAIPANTVFLIWADLLFLILVLGCSYVSYVAADAYLGNDEVTFVGLLGKTTSVPIVNIVKIRRFQSRRNLYFYFSTSAGNFLVIAPMWGEGRNILNALYERKHQT